VSSPPLYSIGAVAEMLGSLPGQAINLIVGPPGSGIVLQA
jgi:hypothetical protein